MKISTNDIMKAVTENDTDRVRMILDDVGLEEKGRYVFSSACRRIASVMLSNASAMALTGKLDEKLANVLISRISYNVEIFDFVYLLSISAGINDDKIVECRFTKTLLEEVATNRFSESTGKKIEKISQNGFKALVSFLISDDPNELDRRFNVFLIRAARKLNIAPDNAIFAYMGLCLTEPTESHIDKILAFEGARSLLDRFADYLGDVDDD